MQNEQKTYLKDTSPEFRIYKADKTPNGPVTILSKKGEPFNKAAKIEFYKYLGYTVLPL